MNDITALAQRMKVKAAHAKKTADWGCDSDNFHDVATPDNVLALVEALEKAQQSNNSAPAILRQLAEEKQKRGEVAAATAFNYAASALQKELSK